MATVIIQSIMKNKTCISTDDKVWFLFIVYPVFLVCFVIMWLLCCLQVEALFELVKGLIKDLDGTLHDEVICNSLTSHIDVA